MGRCGARGILLRMRLGQDVFSFSPRIRRRIMIVLDIFLSFTFVSLLS